MKFEGNKMSEKMDVLNAKVNNALALIKRQYSANDGNLPWLIGYSGGKDSTCTAQLVFRAVKELKESRAYTERKVIIFSSDTMIENPLVKTIVENNINLINKMASELHLPIEAKILRPEISNTYWVNLIGRGYPTPNTTFRWCTDRMKIEPANHFVKECIDAAGEVIMVLGVRQGESNTRDRVLKSHSIEGETLMKHSSLTNAYVFAPIRDFSTTDIFLYLSEFTSPWNSNNKELYFFYEESGGGECPIFLSKEDKTSGNSCGNSRLGCWCCTVVETDKSLTGFIETGWHDELKPLLEFRNWLVSIRDNDEYRMFHRMNGSVYTRKVEVKNDDGGRFLIIPKKGGRKKTAIQIDDSGKIVGDSIFTIIPKDLLSDYMRKNGLSFKDSEMARVILYDRLNDEFSRIGAGPFNEKARKAIFYKLIEAERDYNKYIKDKVKLITDSEIEEIKKCWMQRSIDVSYIDEVLERFGRNKVEIIQDSFQKVSQKYEQTIKTILSKYDLDYEVFNSLVQKEREFSNKTDKSEMIDYIEALFKTDKLSY